MSCQELQCGHALPGWVHAAQVTPGTWLDLETDKDGARHMTKKAVQQLCREHGEFISPECCTTLYLHGHRFKTLKGLESFKAVRVLHLENNCLSSCAGLAHMTDLRALYLQQNNTTVLDGLAACTALATLNISSNPIMQIMPGMLPSSLLTLHAASTGLHDAASIEVLSHDCPQLQVLDLQYNAGLQESSTILPSLCRMAALRVLYTQGCPLCQTPNYRRLLISGLSSLHYLDTAPVDEVERVGARAWLQGGKQAEQAARLAWRQEQRAVQRRNTLSFAVERAQRRLKHALGEQGPQLVNSELPLLQEGMDSVLRQQSQPETQQAATLPADNCEPKQQLEFCHPCDDTPAIHPPFQQNLALSPLTTYSVGNVSVNTAAPMVGSETEGPSSEGPASVAAAAATAAAATENTAAAAVSDEEWWEDAVGLLTPAQLQRCSGSQLQTLRNVLQAVTAATESSTHERPATESWESSTHERTATGSPMDATALVTAARSASSAVCSTAADYATAVLGVQSAAAATAVPMHASAPSVADVAQGICAGQPGYISATGTAPRPRQLMGHHTGMLSQTSMQWVRALRAALNEHAFAPRPAPCQDTSVTVQKRHAAFTGHTSQQGLACEFDNASHGGGNLLPARTSAAEHDAATGMESDVPVFSAPAAAHADSHTGEQHQASSCNTTVTAPATAEPDASCPATVSAVIAANVAECAVCCCELTTGQTCVQLAACRHMFHANCVKKWILTSLLGSHRNSHFKESSITCPLCRASVPLPPDPPSKTLKACVGGQHQPVDLYAFSVQSLPNS